MLKIESILNELSREELINIIINKSYSDKTFEDSIIIKYSKSDAKQQLELCRKFIKSITQKYEKIPGFASDRQCQKFSDEIQYIVDKAMSTKDMILAFDILFLLLNTTVESYAYIHDPSCLVDDVLYAIDKKLIEIDCKNTNLREEIFYKIVEETKKDIFDEWTEYRIALLGKCVRFSDIDSLKNELMIYLKLELSNDDDGYTKWKNEKINLIIFEILLKYEAEDKAWEFAQKNIEYDSFRKKLIEKNMEDKNFQVVLQLASGVQRNERWKRELPSEWKMIKYKAYEGLSQTQEQLKLARELLIEGNIEYFEELKKLTQKNSGELYNEIKNELKQSKDWRSRGVYIQLVENQNDIDEIMEYVKQDTSYIEKYAEVLKEKFESEVVDIYKKYIKERASNAKNRKEYKIVCETIQRYRTITTEENKQSIIKDIMLVYKNKSAFIDELNKIK